MSQEKSEKEKKEEQEDVDNKAKVKDHAAYIGERRNKGRRERAMFCAMREQTDIFAGMCQEGNAEVHPEMLLHTSFILIA